MIGDEKRLQDVRALNALAMEYEVAVVPLPEKDYLKEFYDFYEIKDRRATLTPSGEAFDEAVKTLSGEYRWEAIAERTQSLFGLPRRIMIFEESKLKRLTEALGGPKGLAPFFFVFDLMFCEYEGFTLCFICGSNN